MRRFGGGYNGTPSIFDGMTPDDLVIAFFPCVRFEDQIVMWFMGTNYTARSYTDAQKAEYCLKLHRELSELYELWTELFIIALRRGLRLIVENPNGKLHYMKRYFPIKPKLIDEDRTRNGDYFKKPTQYWFVNCEPAQGFVFEPLEPVMQNSIVRPENRGGIDRQVFRGMIHPQYANRFIRTYILGEGNA